MLRQGCWNRWSGFVQLCNWSDYGPYVGQDCPRDPPLGLQKTVCAWARWTWLQWVIAVVAVAVAAAAVVVVVVVVVVVGAAAGSAGAEVLEGLQAGYLGVLEELRRRDGRVPLWIGGGIRWVRGDLAAGQCWGTLMNCEKMIANTHSASSRRRCRE